jgi:hypothetical protein
MTQAPAVITVHTFGTWEGLMLYVEYDRVVILEYFLRAFIVLGHTMCEGCGNKTRGRDFMRIRNRILNSAAGCTSGTGNYR